MPNDKIDYGELRIVNEDELQNIVKAHDIWLNSGGDQGARANLQYANLEKTDFQGADLRKAYFSGSRLVSAILSGANLQETYLDGADLSNADLTGADLRNSYLSGANLLGAELSRALLAGARLVDARLGGANLSDADLFQADLSKADLRGAILRGTNLRKANMFAADLRGASLSGTDLRGALLSNAKIGSRSCLNRAKLDSLNGFVFSDEQRNKREERAEQVFDVDKKEIVDFTLPEHFNPLKVAKALQLISFLIEGVRLCYTADELGWDDLGKGLDRLELGGAEEDKYAAELVSISMHSPVSVEVATISAICMIIIAAGKAYLTYRGQNLENAREWAKIAMDERRLANEEKQLAHQNKTEVMKSETSLAVTGQLVDLPDDILDQLHAELSESAEQLQGLFRGKIDKPRRRLRWATRVVSLFQTAWMSLFGPDWKPEYAPIINGEPMPMPMPSDDYEP